MKAQLAEANRDEKLCRAYDVPTKPTNTVFRGLVPQIIYRFGLRTPFRS